MPSENIRNLGQYAVVFVIAAVVLSMGSVILAEFSPMTYDTASVSDELHTGSSVGTLPSNFTVDEPKNGVSEITKNIWENNGQEYTNEEHTETEVSTTPFNITLDNTNDGLGFVNGTETVVWEDENESKNYTLTAGTNYTAYPAVSKIQIDTVADLNESEDDFWFNYTTKSNNETLDKPGQYELMDSETGQVQIYDNITNYASSNDNFYVSYSRDNDTTATDVVDAGQSGNETFADFIPILAITAVAGIVIAILLSKFGMTGRS